MTFSKIQCFAPINELNTVHVEEIKNSILENGYVGCPILFFGESLLTGSHRHEALSLIADMYGAGETNIDAYEIDCVEDVSEIIEEKLLKFEEENGYIKDIQYDSIGWLLEGSWVEEYKDEINEW